MSCAFILFGLPAVLIASRKGFAAGRWIFTFGLVGLLVVACLASAKEPGISPEESAARANKANSVGAWLCGINLSWALISLLVILSRL